MSNVYKTYDYSQIPITQLRDKDRENLSKIANFTIRNLCENNNSNNDYPHVVRLYVLDLKSVL